MHMVWGFRVFKMTSDNGNNMSRAATQLFKFKCLTCPVNQMGNDLCIRKQMMTAVTPESVLLSTKRCTAMLMNENHMILAPPLTMA
jgi:hypothetical protein